MDENPVLLVDENPVPESIKEDANEQHGLVKSQLAHLKAAVEKAIPKSVSLELDSKSGNVKKRLEALKLANSKHPERIIAPMRTSVRARAAALTAKSSITNQYSNAYQGKFTPVPRRKYSVQSIVSNINENKMAFEESPFDVSVEISKTKKVKSL